MLSGLLLYASLLAAALRIIYVLYDVTASPLRRIPGPFAARFTRLWYLRSIWGGQAHWENINLHRKYAKDGEHYAPIIRVGPNMYSITRPEKVIYGIGSRMEKSTWYEGWKHPSPDRWTIFTERNQRKHADTRKKFQSMYSMSSLLHYEEFAEAVQDVFRQRLLEMSHEGRQVDMHHWLQCYAFDVIGNITYGRRFGFLNEGKDVNRCMSSLESSMAYSSLVGVYAWAHPVLFTIMEQFPGTGATGRAHIMQFVREQVAEREAQRAQAEKMGAPTHDLNTTRDFLDLAMDAEKDPEKGMTKYNVFMMGVSNVIAGSDTTAVSLSSVLYHLLKYPRTMTLLRAELDQAIEDGRMTPDRLGFKESQNLPYLQACTKEALRLCSATGLPLFRVVPAGGVEIDGNLFPEGTELGINIWTAHYDQSIWGSDAAVFKPERWLEAQSTDPERLKEMDSFFMPFGLGSRTCIGRHISTLEMCKVVPMIVSQFDFELVHGHRDWKTENFWFVRPTDFHVRVRRRA